MAFVGTKIEGDIAILTMNRPGKRNAISDAFLADLEAAFSGLGDNVRAAVPTGAGGHFCAGLDLAEHVE